MPRVRANGVELAYEFHGDEHDPVILLIQGLGLPAAAWPAEFIRLLTSSGYRVLTFDNRDIGGSTRFEADGLPNLVRLAIRHRLGMRIDVPYTLDDMTRDAEQLLAALDIRRAHVVGVSMGGMIAQKLALSAGHAVRTLTSIMSTTNDRHLPQPSFGVQMFIVRGPRDLSAAARREYHRKLWPLIGSPAYPHTTEELEDFIERIFASGIRSSGVARQTAAVIAEPGRAEQLRRLRVPTLVIHGADDPLVRVDCGRLTADSIPGAELFVIEGMGHDLPSALLPGICSRIVSHLQACRDAEQAA
jgi:pimeloyl-ACP methyl ester carboxylesterase